MKIVKYSILDDNIINSFVSNTQEKWAVYDYLMQFAKETGWLDLYIPIWLYNYLKETELENYQTTLLKALRSHFHIYGTTNDETADEILIIDLKEND